LRLWSRCDHNPRTHEFPVRAGCEHTFVPELTSNQKGNIAEAEIAAAAMRLGIGVLRPIVEHGRYDLALEVGTRLLRVQCKWARRERDVIVINLVGFRFTSTGNVRTKYSAAEIDAVAAYCNETDQCYLLPADLVAGMSAIHLRLAPPKNGQRACLNWARDHELAGAIAQLEERCRGTAEVAGSSPASSTPGPVATLGVNECRQKFGWYVERAAAGESFLITRRGKPYARLSPPFEQLIEPSEDPPKLELVGGSAKPP
jgi:prevent-host-death family protein